ncbi:MAG: alpha/beta hydrolase [Actinomycetota bacterium]
MNGERPEWLLVEPEAAMDKVEIGGLEVAYRRQGHGAPLVLLHGAVCDSRVWDDQVEAFSDDFEVIAWDAPGCGKSDDPPGSFRMGDFAACLAGLLDTVGPGPAHVLGHSWGSTLALALCGRRPDLVRSLVLVGAYAGWAGSLPAEEVERRLSFALEMAALGPGRFDPHTMPGLFSDLIPPDRAQRLGAVMAEARPSATVTMARSMAESDLRADLAATAAPTLLVYGEGDQRAGLDVAADLHRRLMSSELVVLAGLGHECYLESPAAFEAAVRPFLAAH